MTFKNLKEKIEKLEEIANTETVASEVAKKLLQEEVTSYNIIKIEKLLESFDRNR